MNDFICYVYLYIFRKYRLLSMRVEAHTKNKIKTKQLDSSGFQIVTVVSQQKDNISILIIRKFHWKPQNNIEKFGFYLQSLNFDEKMN